MRVLGLKHGDGDDGTGIFDGVPTRSLGTLRGGPVIRVRCGVPRGNGSYRSPRYCVVALTGSIVNLHARNVDFEKESHVDSVRGLTKRLVTANMARGLQV